MCSSRMMRFRQEIASVKQQYLQQYNRRWVCDLLAELTYQHRLSLRQNADASMLLFHNIAVVTFNCFWPWRKLKVYWWNRTKYRNEFVHINMSLVNYWKYARFFSKDTQEIHHSLYKNGVLLTKVFFFVWCHHCHVTCKRRSTRSCFHTVCIVCGRRHKTASSVRPSVLSMNSGNMRAT